MELYVLDVQIEQSEDRIAPTIDLNSQLTLYYRLLYIFTKENPKYNVTYKGQVSKWVLLDILKKNDSKSETK